MDFGLILLALAGIAMLVGLVAVFLGHKSWSVLTLVFAVLNILMAVAVMFLGARVLKLHANFQQEVNKWQTRLTALEQEYNTVLNGNENAEGDEKIAYSDLKFKLLQAQATRGRAWGIAPNEAAKPLTVQTARDGKVTLNIAQGIEGGVGIDVGMFVHAFANVLTEDRTGNKIRPTANDYLGYYRVSAADDKKVELTRIDRGDALAGNINNQPVLLYETAPADRHDLFAGKAAEELKLLLGTPSEYELWAMQNDMQPVDAIPTTGLDAEQQKLVQNQIWWRMKFLKSLELPKPPARPVVAGAAPVDADAEKPPEQINEGDVLLLDAVTAAKLQKDGIAEPDGDKYKVFVRPLNDFVTGFSQAIDSRERLERTIADSVNRTKLNEQTKVTTASVIDSHKAGSEKLKTDLQHFQTDRQVVEQSERELVAALANAEKRESELLSQIAQNGTKLVQAETKLIQQLNAQQGQP